MSIRRIPDATVGRLPVYLRVLMELGAAGQQTVSSDQLAEGAGVNAAKVRKDLSHLGSYGTRGVGYEVDYLRFEIASRLGLGTESSVAIIGMGNLGHALANHGGFSDRGFVVTALFDNDPAKIGTKVDDLTIRPLAELDPVAGAQISIGVISTPPGVAQVVADQIVEAGIGAILNFAPTVISVPDEVTVRKVDLTLELQILGFYQARHEAAAQSRPVASEGD